VVLGNLLGERGKLPAAGDRVEYYVIDGEEADFATVMETVGALRRSGRSAEFGYKRQSIGKQLKAANRRGAARAAIVRGETVSVKDLATGEQADRPLAELLAPPAD
jgi:histidyl-tRNA synthetase